jgi:AcrR family transcriptional regulator
MPARRTKQLAASRTRVRLSREERIRNIVAGATEFFAEHGMTGQTRDLAAQLGITHALLYRYFPSKQALIERVYHDVFLDRWSPDWEPLLTDHTKSMAERLVEFYLSYARMILTKQAVRIFVYSGLNQSTIPKRFLKRIEQRVFHPLINALRAEQGLDDIERRPATEAESEMFWHLHGSIFYLGIRRWIYGLPVPEDLDAAVRQRCASFLIAAPELMREALQSSQPRRSRARKRADPD